MSRVVKNLRRCSPRARWKMLAPCMTVLSTSKNAAAVGSGGWSSAVSTSAAAAAASPASVDRCWRLRGVRGRSAGGHQQVPQRSRRHTRTVWKYPSMAAGPASRRRGPPRCRRPPRTPTGSRSSSPAAVGVTWAELDDEVGRIATGLGAAGIVAGHRVMIVLGNRIEFVSTLPRRPAGPGGRRTGEPDARTAGELARMIADSGSRMVVADVDTVTAVRGAVPALDEAHRPSTPRARSRPT